MRRTIARAVMTLVVSCLGESRRDWALAMRGEFEAADQAGEALPFALGCLVAAGRSLPTSAEGRLLLASHALALGIFLPLAVLQLDQASSLAGPFGVGRVSGPYQIAVFGSAVPSLMALWAALGLGQLALAWVLLERQWEAAVRVSAGMLATMLTLVCTTTLLLLDDAAVSAQMAVLVMEVAAVHGCSRWHSRLGTPDLRNRYAA